MPLALINIPRKDRAVAAADFQNDSAHGLGCPSARPEVHSRVSLLLRDKAMYTAKTLVDGGAHGSVYRGDDDLGRAFAIKLIRSSVGDREFVLEQARALARVESDFVVRVQAIEDVIDPDTGNPTPAIIMPWLDGKTLDKLLAGPRPSPEEVKRIGIGMIMGMKAIHAAGLVHGDFHFRNVMVGDHWVKVIDILYRNTLAGDTTEVKEVRLQSDRNALRSLLGDLLTRISVEVADEFNRSLTPESTLDDIHVVFADVTNPRVTLDVPKLVDSAVARVSDSAFVDSDDYASALSEEIPNRVVRPLLETMIAKAMTQQRHKAFLRVLWDRLSTTDQEHVCVDLAQAINREVPNGDFPPHLRMLSAFGKQGWEVISKATRIRLESAITESLASGAYEALGGGLLRGDLGTWVRSFYRYFKGKAEVRKALKQLLRGSWNTQNYVGRFLLTFIPVIAETESDREEFIQAVAKAVSDNAWEVKANLEKLPEDWRNDIAAMLGGDEEDEPEKTETASPTDPPLK